MQRVLIIFLTILCALITVASLDSSIAADKSIIRVTGAGSMFGRLHTLSQLYEKENPAVDINIVNSESVDTGFATLMQGNADITMASRKIADQENEAARTNGIELVESLIGYGGIVVVTHPSNPLRELTVEQIQKLLRGDCVAWKEFGGSDEAVKVFGVGKKHPGTVAFMQKDFLGNSPLCSTAEIMPDFPSVLNKVAATPGAIGYVRIRDALENSGIGPCNIVKVKNNPDSQAIMPCRASVKDGTYPIRRPYYLYFNSKAPDPVRKYVDFIVAKGWGQENL